MTTIPLTVSSLHSAVLEPLRIVPGPEIELRPPKVRNRETSDGMLMQKLKAIQPGTRVRVRDLCNYSAASRVRMYEMARNLPGYSVLSIQGPGGRCMWISREK